MQILKYSKNSTLIKWDFLILKNLYVRSVHQVGKLKITKKVDSRAKLY